MNGNYPRMGKETALFFESRMGKLVKYSRCLFLVNFMRIREFLLTQMTSKMKLHQFAEYSESQP